MDSASENEEMASNFLSDHSGQFIITDEDSRDDDDDMDRTGVLREQDRFLPIANVARLMKKSIPKTGKIAKDARECVQECVSEFVSFITSEASERCHQEKRKTINGEDILFAMQTLGFDNYLEPLKIYLAKFRESMKGEQKGLLDECGNNILEGLSGSSNIGTPTPTGTTSFMLISDPTSSGGVAGVSGIVNTKPEENGGGSSSSGTVIFYTAPGSSGGAGEFRLN